MPPGELTPDAEAILLYLLATRVAVERTKRAIRDACQLNEAYRADRALLELIQAKYVADVGDSTFELTQIGLQRSRILQADNQARTVNNIHQHIERVENGQVTMAGIQENLKVTPASTGKLDPKQVEERGTHAKSDTDPNDISRTMPGILHNLPTVAAHPLRVSPSRETPPDRPSKRAPLVTVRYLLAFEMPKDALPIPVLHNDVMGRSRNANISLRHDEFISGHHCRFEVRRDPMSPYFNLYVEDMNSRNGTYLDDVMIPEGLHRVYHASRIRIGNTTLVAVQIPY